MLEDEFNNNNSIPFDDITADTSAEETEEYVSESPLDEEGEDESPFSILEGTNLVESFLSDEQIETLRDFVLDGFREDLRSNEEHFENLKKGTELLGIKLEKGTELGEWACAASHPLITENAIKFQAQIVNELDLPDNLVKTKIIGSSVDEELELSAMRKQEFMNYYLTTVIDDEFYLESSRLALNTAFFGTGFKFNYWDETSKRICTEALRVDQLIVNHSVKALSKAPRYTILRESSDVDVIQKMNSGLFRQISLDKGNSGSDTGEVFSPITDELNDIIGVDYECERLLAYTYILLDAKELIEGGVDESMEDDAEHIAEGETKDEVYYDRTYLPFVVITELNSNEILGVYANWYDDGKGNPYTVREYVTDYHFIPGFGFYSLGYVHVLGNFSKMLTSIMRSLVDAGTFASLSGGFKLRGTKINGTKTVAPGEFIDVETTAQDISKAVMALPFKEPSAVLNAMYTQLEARGQMFANATEGVTQGASNYGPVGTTMALLEASSKLTTAIVRGFHRSRRREYAVIARLMKENMTSYPYSINGVSAEAFVQDFDPAIPVFPVSDPNVPSQSQRLALAQQKLQVAQQFPQVHDLREALKDVYRGFGETNVDRLLPSPQEAQPADPLSDCLAASNGMPIKAFEGQDHQSHINFKQAFVQNPSIANNELMVNAVNAIMSNIREHTVLQIMEQIKGMSQQQAMSEAAQAAAMQQITQMQQVAMQAQQSAMDPTMALAQAQAEKNQIEREKIQSDEVRDYAALAIKKEALDLEKQKVAMEQKLSYDALQADLHKSAEKAKNDMGLMAIKLLGDAASQEEAGRQAAHSDHRKMIMEKVKPVPASKKSKVKEKE